MNSLLKKLHHRISWVLSSFEHYFLGPKRVALNEHPLKNRAIVIFREDQDESVSLHGLTFDEKIQEGLLIYVVPASAEETSMPLSSSLLLKPRYLEQIIPMINALDQNIKNTHPVVLMFFYISHIPCQKELLSNISASTNYHYDRAFLLLMSEIKRLSFRQKIVVIVDNESVLGKKNSALLRRMFGKSTL